MFAHTQVNSRPAGTQLTAVGGVAGVVVAGGLGVLLFRSQDQSTAILLTLVYAAPYFFALIAAGVRDHAARGGLLLALGLASLVASLSSLAGVALVLLPATAMVLVASVQSISAADYRFRRTTSFFLAGLAVPVVLVVSVFVLTRSLE